MFEETFESVIEQDFAIAYLKLLAQYPYKQITVTMLVESAGYGRATFYAYFSGLRELRRRLSDYDLAFYKKFVNIALKMKTPEERVELIVADVYRHMKLFWSLCHENNMPQHLDNMKLLLHDLLKDSFEERFKECRFSSQIVQNFCIVGTIHMSIYYFSHLLANPDIDPQILEETIKFGEYLLFSSNASDKDKLGGNFIF